METLKIDSGLSLSHYCCFCLSANLQSLRVGGLGESGYAALNETKGYLYHIKFILPFAIYKKKRLSNEVMHMEGIDNIL